MSTRRLAWISPVAGLLKQRGKETLRDAARFGQLPAMVPAAESIGATSNPSLSERVGAQGAPGLVDAPTRFSKSISHSGCHRANAGRNQGTFYFVRRMTPYAG